MQKLNFLSQSSSFIRYLKNSSWMVVEQVFKIVAGLFVSIYVARYLGPEQFGVLSFALAIVAVFMALSRLGMDNVLVRDISRSPEKMKEYLGTAFGLMLIGSFTVMCLLSLFVYFLEKDIQTKLYILIIGAGLFFQTLSVMDYSFQAQVKAKYSSIAKTIALTLSSMLKIYLVWIEADLLLFALAFALDAAFIGVMLLVVYIIKKQPNFLRSFQSSLVKPILISAWPMVLVAGIGVLFLKLSQIMLGFMVGDKELGLYTAALRLYEGWIIIPQVLALSLIPAIVSLKKQSNHIYENKMVVFMRGIIAINLGVAIFVSIFAEEIIKILYGETFMASAPVLRIVIWCAVIMGIGSVSFRYLVNEELERKIVHIMVVALVSNVILNVVLIPIMGIEGAAWALLLSLLNAYVFYDFFDKKMFRLKIIKLRAIYVK